MDIFMKIFDKKAIFFIIIFKKILPRLCQGLDQVKLGQVRGQVKLGVMLSYVRGQVKLGQGQVKLGVMLSQVQLVWSTTCDPFGQKTHRECQLREIWSAWDTTVARRGNLAIQNCYENMFFIKNFHENFRHFPIFFMKFSKC